MTRRELLGGGLAAALPAVRTRSRRPNVLFILPDQMRGQAMGSMGEGQVRTLHLDRLASEGVLFRNTLANSPVCCPARAILMTGQYCHRNGMVANDLRLRESHVTIAEILRQNGYRTGYIGKWHLDGGPRLPGFVPPGERRRGFEFWAANECSHNHFHNQYFRDTDKPIPLTSFETEGWTDVALEFLEAGRKDQRPFFLMVSMGPPHDPYGAPEKYMKLYDPEKLALRPNWKQAEQAPGRKELAAYYAAITSIDDQVGRMTKALDEFGMAEDTIVLFSSDHGDMLGSHGLRLKRKPWEESIRVPCIVRYPGKIRAGRVEDGLFSHIDFAPTLIRLCGGTPAARMQGTDLSALVLGRGRTAPQSAFFQIFGPYQAGGVAEGWRGVRTGRHMYARFESRPWVLYDLEKDPYELENLVDDPAAKPILQRMEKLLEGWMKKTGDSWSYNWHDPVEDRGRLYRHRVFYTVEEYLAWAREHPEAEKQ
jgi:arylsulfatase A-like enzyme